jgi:hypothetical protein
MFWFVTTHVHKQIIFKTRQDVKGWRDSALKMIFIKRFVREVNVNQP